MARARNIKPGFFANEDLAEIEPMGRLLFIGLWTIADREGRLEDRPKRIKGELFPYDNCDINSLLGDLEKWNFIKRYEVAGKRYIQILTFKRHQNPHINEKASEIPPMEMQEPELHSTSTVQVPDKNSTNPADSLNPDSLITDSSNTTTTTTTTRTREDEWQEVASTYSNNIHPITGQIELDRLSDLFTKFGKTWMLEAISEAVTSCRGSPSLKYVQSILDRWKRDGFKSGRKDKGRSSPSSAGQSAEDIKAEALRILHGGAESG